MTSNIARFASLGVIPLLLLGTASISSPIAAADPVLPGLGEVDGWVDATGDQMFGNLDMDVNNILFRGTALNANTAGNLLWDGNAVCVVGSTLAGCSGAGDITAVTAGTGLTGGGTTGAVTLAVDTAAIQSRVTGTCAAGSSIRAIASDGTATCETDDVGTGTVTSVATGTGLTGGPITSSGTVSLSLNGGSAQTCSGTQKASAISPTGILTCSADVDTNSGGTVTSVATGAGLTGGPITSSGTVSIANGGVTTAMLAFDPATQAELDAHKASGDHDGRYKLAGDYGDIQYATGGASIPGSAAVTISSITVTTPDKCPGAENHVYKVEVSGFGYEGAGASDAYIEPTIDSATMTFGPPLRAFHIDSASIYYGDFHSFLVLTNVQPGSHTFRLLASAPTGAYTLSRGEIVAEHLGWTGC